MTGQPTVRVRADLGEPVNAAAADGVHPMPGDFADYLEAKYALDERSLNADVRRACLERIAARPLLRWLDAGTGTGAMVRRLVKDVRGSAVITALDRDAALLDRASSTLAAGFEHDGYRTLRHSGGIEAYAPERRIFIDFACCDLLDSGPRTAGRFDLVTAHALMDVVPLESTLARVSSWLGSGGLLYATLTYDGATTLLPLHGDEAFESELLAEYDASMERRRVAREATGGACAGRRLHASLGDAGFDVIACGSSDWSITPFGGRYRDRDADVLRTLLACIHDEGARAPNIDPASLAEWYATRRAAIDTAELAIIVHQLDMLAMRREA